MGHQHGLRAGKPRRRAGSATFHHSTFNNTVSSVGGRPASPRAVGLEVLEDRRLMSYTVAVGPMLLMVGDEGTPNTMTVALNADGRNVTASLNGQSQTVPLAGLSVLRLYGGTGSDTITVDPRLAISSCIVDGNGNDTIRAGAGDDYMYVGKGHDLIISAGGHKNLFGTDANDTILGSNGNDPVGGGTPVDAVLAPQPVISMIESSIMAGSAVDVQGMGTMLAAGTPLTARYVWNFGDPSGAHNQIEGFNAAHVYDTPGTYVITLQVTNEAGVQAAAAAQVTVAPDTRRVIYLDNHGSDWNTGLSPAAPVQSLSRAMQLIANNTELLLARGETFGVGQGLTIGYQNVVVGAYGAGDNPVLRYAGHGSNPSILTLASKARDVTVQDLTFDSPGSDNNTAATGIFIGGVNLTVRRNRFLNVDDALNLNASPTGVLIQDNTAPLASVWRTGGSGVHDYFAWVQGSDISFIGNNVANSGLHTIRMGKGYSRVLLSANSLSELDGWTTLDIHDGEYLYVASNLLGGGDVGIGPLGGTDGLTNPNYKTIRTSWVVLENNVVLQGAINVCHGTEHLMVRNNVLRRYGKAAITVGGYNWTYQAGVTDVSILNNTGYNNGANGNFLYVYGDVQSDRSGQITLDDNLYVAPNMVTGQYQTAAVYVTNTDLSSFREVKNNVWNAPKTATYAHGGYFYVWPSWSNSQGYKTPAQWDAYAQVSGERYQNVTLDSRYAPSAGSLAISGCAPVHGVFTDLYGAARPTASWSAGAVQALLA